MAKFELECIVTATVRETWRMEAETAEQARERFEEELTEFFEHIRDETVGDESDREIVSVEKL